jgi:ribosome-associated heat shock protein Hsp15
LIENRVSAPLAIICYENQTPQEEMLKFDNWFVGKKGGEFREKGLGRPTKRERRTLDKFKDKE